MRNGLRISAAMLLAAGSVAAAPVAPAEYAAIDRLEKGQWELHARGEAGAHRRICLGDARQLLQSEHAGLPCSRFTISDTATQVTVTYQCGAAGSGRTDLRIETPRLVQIQSQGVADGAPFSFALEGRRIGAC